MPIYEYRCAACGHTLDALQKLSEGPLRKCPVCKKLALKRLMSAPSFRLKGGGWYETDFKSDGEKKRNLVEASGATESAGSDGAKADAPKADGAAKEAKESKTKEAAGTAPKEAKPAAKDVKRAAKEPAKSVTEPAKSVTKPSSARSASS